MLSNLGSDFFSLKGRATYREPFANSEKTLKLKVGEIYDFCILKKTLIFILLQNSMFAACKEKPNKPAVYGPLCGRFGPKKAILFINMLNALGFGNVQDTKFGARVFILNHIMARVPSP